MTICQRCQAGLGQVDYFIELFAAQEQLWCDRSPLYDKMKHRQGAVYAEMAVSLFAFDTNWKLRIESRNEQLPDGRYIFQL